MSDEQISSRKARIPSAEAHAYVKSILEVNGVSPEHASIVADCLVAADLRGVDTHGVNRIPSYVARIRQGVLDPKAEPELKEITPVVAQVDGKNGFGFVSAKLGMAKAIDMAKVFGIGMVSVKHSNHFGMSAWVVQQALDAGLMSLVFTNSSPALPVWGGKSNHLSLVELQETNFHLFWIWRRPLQLGARFIKRSAVVREYQKIGH